MVPTGVTKLERECQSFVVRQMRLDARKLRNQANSLYHEEPEQIAVYLTMAYALELASDDLVALYKARRAEEDDLAQTDQTL